ncbi:MAG: RpiB/LacA/LacB family sugar-phosphate isomerase [Algisphaera sp.]
MKIMLGADHRGRALLLELTVALGMEGHTLTTVDTVKEGAVDYPDVAFRVACAVASGEADRGVLVCGSGIGSCIVANKMVGVRAALAHDEIAADMARRHHDANVLCLAADLMAARVVDRVIQAFLNTPFEGGRHARRLEKIAAIEAERQKM